MITGLSMLGLACATLAIAADPTMPVQVQGASHIIGAEVENRQGDDLGDINDGGIDSTPSSMVYVVLAAGGFLGLGEKYVAIPMRALQLKPDDEDEFILDIDTERLTNAPGFDKEDWPNMAAPTRGEQIHAYYGQQAHWEKSVAMRQNASNMQK
jgi:hypothetical protein